MCDNVKCPHCGKEIPVIIVAPPSQPIVLPVYPQPVYPTYHPYITWSYTTSSNEIQNTF